MIGSDLMTKQEYAIWVSDVTNKTPSIMAAIKDKQIMRQTEYVPIVQTIVPLAFIQYLRDPQGWGFTVDDSQAPGQNMRFLNRVSWI